MLLAACRSVLQLVQEIVDLRPCPTTVFVSDPNMPKLHSVYAVEEKTTFASLNIYCGTNAKPKTFCISVSSWKYLGTAV
jgi:hypothetical protein